MVPFVRMTGICKSFGLVRVLHEVDFELRAGEVHALVGENGAGKSTLMKVLGGVHAEYEGTIEIDGQAVRPRTPTEASALGVAIMHQELSLVPTMSVVDNLMLGRWPTRAGFVAGAAQRHEVVRWLNEFRVAAEPEEAAGALPVAVQQMIEICKALSRRARVLVMDEPTSALGSAEVERLFHVIADLRARGCGIVYITHRMEEIRRVADRITVMRDGRRVGTAAAAELTDAQMLQWMVGRPMAEQIHRLPVRPGAERLRVERLSVVRGGRRVVHDVSFAVRAGEVLGIAGLQGAGGSELLMALFGAYGRPAAGAVRVDGQAVSVRNPRSAIAAGLALLTNDRKATGLVMPMSVAGNATLADLRRLSLAGWRRPAREYAAVRVLAGRLRLRAASADMPVAQLSGGSQQKVALAKWLQVEPRVLLLDEPTRGIDIGAKHEIYELINEWTARGMAIALITSDLPELLALADRIIVLHRGRVVAELSRAEATADRVIAAAMGAN